MTLQELLIFAGGILLGWATAGWVAVCLFRGLSREMDQAANDLDDWMADEEGGG